MQEKRLWKLFFYLNLISLLFAILQVYSLFDAINILVTHEQCANIAMKVLWGLVLDLCLIIGAYYQFKVVLFYNLYLFSYGLKSTFDFIANYKTQHAADFGSIVLHYNFSLDDCLNILSIVTNNISCAPGLILLGIYTICWIKQVRLRRQVSHSGAKGD